MKYRFCEVFTYQKQLYLVRRANANGPDCMVFPPKRLAEGLSPSQLASEIQAALDSYADLGRSIDPLEWDARGQELLDFFGEGSQAAFRRKVREVAIRQDPANRTFSLFVGHSGNLLCELQSLDDVAGKLFDVLGVPDGSPGAALPTSQ